MRMAHFHIHASESPLLEHITCVWNHPESTGTESLCIVYDLVNVWEQGYGVGEHPSIDVKHVSPSVGSLSWLISVINGEI